MIDPAVQGALIGVGGMAAFHTGKIAFDYLRLKINKDGKQKNGFCSQHYKIVTLLQEIKNHYKEEKQIELYVEAIKRAKNTV